MTRGQGFQNVILRPAKDVRTQHSREFLAYRFTREISEFRSEGVFVGEVTSRLQPAQHGAQLAEAILKVNAESVAVSKMS